MTANGNIKYRVEQVEDRVDSLDAKLDKILENHLPHIQMEIVALRTRVNVATVVNVAAIILGVIASKIL